MALNPGTRLGPYEIAAPLGAGGMGEVYRARDTKLNRDVAIKVLPDVFLHEPDRLSRFEREAHVLASLNHANVAQIYGIEDAGPVRALVMELVEGPTLADRIARGALPLDEALPIAKQIADALEAAHERGIIHRDLKPANIKIRDDGTVKVLDFGLAKSLDPRETSPDALMHSPTFTSPATELGMILGTAAYMAPEQAKGKAVDKRADIWAFGCVLYEMLTGHSAFDGETVTDVLAAVVTREPDWTRLPPATSAGVRRLLKRCLERDPKRRLRDIGDAQPELTGDDPVPVPIPSGARRPAWLPLVGAACLAIGAAGGWWSARARVATSAVVPSFTLRQLTQLPGAETHPDLSPDGRQLVYVSGAAGSRDIYLLRVGGDRALNLTANSSSDDTQPAFSSDGEMIAFRSSRDGGGLFVMGATGESVRRLATAGYDPAWSPDRRFLAYATHPIDDPYSRQGPAQLWKVDVESGATTRLVADDGVQPAWSPDGQRIAYWSNINGQRDIRTVAADGGEPTAITDDAATDWSPEWSPDGRWLYFSSDRGGSMNVWRARVDPASGRRIEDPQPVTTGVRDLAYLRFSAGGTRLVAMAYERSVDVSIYEVAGAEKLRPIASLRPPSAHWCSPSPDGSWLTCSTTGTHEDVVLLRTDGSELRRLTNDAHKDRVPLWSPDGQSLAFYSTRGGQWDYWSIRIDGSGLRKFTAIGEVNFGAWSPDSQEFITAMVDSAEADVLWRVRVGQNATLQAAVKMEKPAGAERFTLFDWAAGDRLAGAEIDHLRGARTFATWRMQSGTYQRYKVPAVGPAFGSIAGWLPDSRHFIARSTDGVVLVDADDGTWRVLMPCRAEDRLMLSHNGRRLVVEREVLDSDIWMLEEK